MIVTDQGSSGDKAAIAEIDRLIHEPARLVIMAHLYVVDSADFIYLMRQTGLTWGNLSAHITRLEEGGYLQMEKGFNGRKPYTMLHLTERGRKAFQDYRQYMIAMLNSLPG